MDLLPKTVVGIRNEARSAVYRAALGTNTGRCFGFLLGFREPFESPALEFSLISSTPDTEEALWTAPRLLQAHLIVAERVAKYSGTKVIGIFTAWQDFPFTPRNQLFGLYLDTAQAMQIPYVVHFPTTAYETIWGTRCFFANRFPHDGMRYRSVRGKISIKPRHNPRRVRALWHKLLRENHNASHSDSN